MAKDRLEKYISLSHEFSLKNEAIESLMSVIIFDSLSLVGLIFGLMMVFAIIPSLIQNGFNISLEPITPKFEKISVTKGLKRMFSSRSLVEFVKGVLKITLIGIISYLSVINHLPRLEMMPEGDTEDILEFLLMLCMKVLIPCCIAIFFIAIADFIYQKAQHKKQLMMSVQDVKDEYKQQEGDPKIKGKLRQLRMERSRQRMMQAVPQADVIITNPTHYAVALKYEHDKMDAPVVLAMGADDIALRIKKAGEENKIPIVRNAPLARALYDECELDQAIPLEHFQAVAEVISYVYKLKGRKF
jgi:flagellar biosynthetic protein FlhB